MKKLSILALLLASTLATACATGAEDLADDTTSDSSAEVAVRPRFELWKDAAGAFRFRLLAANSQTLVSSEAYSSRTAALNGLLSVLSNGSSAGRFELRTATNAQSYFVLKAANAQVIATSETYSTRAAASDGIAATLRAVAAYLEHWDTATGARYDVFQGADGRFYFDLRAKNGSIVLTSQGYEGQASALNGAFAVAENGVAAAQYQVLQAADGRWYFNLTSTNGQVIATSQMYATKGSATRGRDAVISLIPTVELL
jgi:uncharacterized protein YegP (UPF0339 family)